MKANLDSELASLERMNVPQLKAVYEEVFNEPARSGNKVWLYKRCAWGVQARALGGLPERARRRALEIANDMDIRMKAPKRIPVAIPYPAPGPVARKPAVGTILSRTYKGREIRVLVRDDGFEHDGQIYRSLTAVATAVTGSHWNGRLFFGIAGGKAQG